MTINPSHIFNISSDKQFDNIALGIFHFQYLNNPIYKRWVDGLNIQSQNVSKTSEIPFLPIQFFKSHEILSTIVKTQAVFKSSGTGFSGNSYHYISDLKLYEESFTRNFHAVYGDPQKYHILALLPSYLERKDSSLIYMMDCLIKNTSDPHSGFYLNNIEALNDKLLFLKDSPKKTILWGVSYALLDFCEQYSFTSNRLIVVETGGMKGKRAEISRSQLHKILCESFEVEAICSEYGMTELLSQAYSLKNGVFHTPPWMKISIRDPHDPFSYMNFNRNGVINIIDLANIYSCSFIATDDIGLLHKDGGFEVLGRSDNSDIRGCNLLYS